MNFKSIFKKQNILPVAVLLAICIVVAGVLGAVNLLTADRIADNENAKIYESLTKVLDGHITPLEKLPEGTPKSVTGIYEVRESSSSTTLKGKIVTVVVKGYAGDIAMTVGVKADGTVSKVIITSQSESHGKAGMSSYPDKFAGVSAENVGSVDLFTGATVSSTAIRNGVSDAVKAAMGTSEPEKEVLPKTDEEILELAGELVGDGVSFTDVTPDDGETVKRVYKISESRGYVAYLVVMSRYGTPETETLVHFDRTGKIVAVKKLVWSPSPANPDYGYYPPSEDVVDAFYAKFVGQGSASFTEKFVKIDGVDKEVEHAAGATSTSNNVASAIAKAFTFVDELVKKDLPREESEIIDYAGELTGEDTLEDVTPGNTVFVKRLYKLGGNKGYVAYVVVISGYGTPETETLVHFDNTGKIAAVKKIVWSPSPANPDYPFYQPPTEDVVDAFYAKFIGHDSASFTEKFVKIEGVDKEVEHAAGTTTTSNNLANAIAEAFSYVDEMNGGEATGEEEVSYAARIIGIVILCASFAAVAAIIITKSIKRRRAK